MWATLQGKKDVLCKLIELIADAQSRAVPRVITRALVVEGIEGVGKTYLLRQGMDVARQRGIPVVGPVDGRDLTGCPLCWNSDSREPDLLGGNRLPMPAGDKPLLIMVDDAHRVDEDRLRLEMRWLSRRYQTSTIWMITGRSLGRLTTLAADEVVFGSLGDLSEDAVAELVTEVLGTPPTEGLSQHVAQAGGNPRLVTELVLGLREEGALCPTDGRMRMPHPAIPQRVRRVVRNYLDALSPRCRWLLQVAAVLDRQLCLSNMADIMAKPVASLLPLLEEPTDAGLVISDGSRLMFRNTLLWRAIRASAPVYMHAALRQEAGDNTVGPGSLPQPRARRSKLDTTWPSLSETERTIARFAGDGLTNQQIAHRVFLSPHTVNYHLRSIFRKLEVPSRIGLAKLLADADLPGTKVDPTS